MKKTIITTLFIFMMVASFALAIEEPIPTNAQETEAVACCMAMTAECLACVEGMTVEEYCAEEPNMMGCEDVNEKELTPIQQQQKEARAIGEQLKAEYGDDVEAVRQAYQEQAREMLQEYQGDMKQLANEYRAKSVEELQGFINAQKELAEEELEEKKEAIKEKVQKQLQEENEVRIAVHTLLAMKNLTGNIGQQVSEIAREFNNKINQSTELKQQADEKKGLARVFTGGDEETAQKLKQEANNIQEKVRELKSLQEEANLNQEVQTILDEQIQTLEEEERRLEQLAKKESKRGLFGWLWKNKISFE